MMSDLLLNSGPGRRLQRACGDRFWMVPIAVGVAVLTAWMVVARPFARIQDALRADGPASPEILYVAAVSMAGLAAAAAFVLCAALYVAGMHAAGRLR